MLVDVMSKLTGMSTEKIAEETERDKYLSAQEAKEYGLIDDVLKEDDENKDKKSTKDK